jgi:hypothetical protein
MSIYGHSDGLAVVLALVFDLLFQPDAPSTEHTNTIKASLEENGAM